MSFSHYSSEQILGVSKEWTLDCDMLFDEEKLKNAFQDIENVRKNYENMFLQIRADMGVHNPDTTKIYVEKIDVIRDGGIISYRVQYDNESEKSFVIGTIRNDALSFDDTTTFGILRHLSDIKEGGGKWNAYNNLNGFFRGFMAGWKGRLEKIGISIDEDISSPVMLLDPDVSPRISIIFKNKGNKTIVTEKKPRSEKSPDGEADSESEAIMKQTYNATTDVLENGKNKITNIHGQKVHTLLGVLYTQKIGSGMRENARKYLEQVLLSSSTLTLNSELPELGGILQAIIDSQILRKNSTKSVIDTLTRLRLHLLECEISIQREKADTNFFSTTHHAAQEHEMLLGTILNPDRHQGNYALKTQREDLLDTHRIFSEESGRATEIARNELVCSSIEHIVLVMSTLNEEFHRATYCDILVTNGQYGMAGLCSMFDYRVISSSKVIENSPEEKKLFERFEDKGGSQNLMFLDTKDTTGCGDISMSAWLSGKFEIGQFLRESEYYRIFKIIGTTNDISAEQYRRAIAITEAYWRMAFTRVMSGLMFRVHGPNLSLISTEAMASAIEFVSGEVGHFMLRELADFVHGSKHVSDNGFFHMHAIAKMNRTGGRGSLEILCEREGISEEHIVVRQGELLKKGIETKDEAFRRAKTQLLHEKWGWKNDV